MACLVPGLQEIIHKLSALCPQEEGILSPSPRFLFRMEGAVLDIVPSLSRFETGLDPFGSFLLISLRNLQTLLATLRQMKIVFMHFKRTELLFSSKGVMSRWFRFRLAPSDLF
jgi:hypothetical protein